MPGKLYIHLTCLDFTYMCDQKILGLLVDCSPLFLVYHLPPLKCVRIL